MAAILKNYQEAIDKLSRNCCIQQLYAFYRL